MGDFLSNLEIFFLFLGRFFGNRDFLGERELRRILGGGERKFLGNTKKYQYINYD